MNLHGDVKKCGKRGENAKDVRVGDVAGEYGEEDGSPRGM